MSFFCGQFIVSVGDRAFVVCLRSCVRADPSVVARMHSTVFVIVRSRSFVRDDLSESFVCDRFLVIVCAESFVHGRMVVVRP